MTFLNVPLIIFCPPLYFLLHKKWLGFLFNAVIYALAILFLITVFLAIGGVIMWFIAVLHAVWSFRSEMIDRQTTKMATKMAAAMKAA